MRLKISEKSLVTVCMCPCVWHFTWMDFELLQDLNPQMIFEGLGVTTFAKPFPPTNKKSKVSSNLLKRIKQLSQSIIHNFWEWDNFKRQYCFAAPKCGELQNEVKVLIYWLTPKERNEFFLKKTGPMHMVSTFLCSHICSKAENSCFEENSFHCNPICFFLNVNMLLEFSVAVWWKLRLHFRVRTPSATADSNGSFLTSYDNPEEKSGNEEVWELLVSTFGYSPPFQDCFSFFFIDSYQPELSGRHWFAQKHSKMSLKHVYRLIFCGRALYCT